MHTSFPSTLKKFDSNLWHYHVPVPLDIAEALIEGDNRRVVCTINDRHTWQAALMKCDPYWMILVNKEMLKKLGIQEHDKVTVTLEKDRTEYGLPMTEEMEIVLAQDDEGREYFQQLTMGKQRSLIYLAGQVKNSNSRVNRALAIMHHLKEANGKLDFRQLNEVIKMYNNKGKMGF